LGFNPFLAWLWVPQPNPCPPLLFCFCHRASMFDAYVAVAIAPQYENFHTTTFEWARVRPGWNIFMYSFLSLISDMWLLYEELAVHVLIPNLVEKADLLFIMSYVILILLSMTIIHQKERIFSFTLLKISILHNLSFSFYLWLESSWALVLIVGWDIQSLNSSLRIHYHLLLTK
jgi:hypothetical protein